MADLLVGVIMGLGESSAGRLLGLRATLQDERIAGTFDLAVAEHNNREQLEAMAAAMETHPIVFLIGHSLGGEQVYFMAYNAGQLIAVVLLLDSVREDSGGFDSDGRYAPLPNVLECVAYYGTKDFWPAGGRFDPGVGVTNTPLHVGHSQVPVDPQVSEFIIAKILRLKGTTTNG